MKDKQIQYNGNNIFNIKGNFGLYSCEGIDELKSMDIILVSFKYDFESKLKEVLNKIGLKYCDLIYYSPKEYNFSNDSIDLIIKVINKNLFKKFILKYKKEIDLSLNKNISYDGYTALTVNNYKEEFENLDKPFYEPDVLILKTILNKLIDFSDFDINEYLVFEDIE